MYENVTEKVSYVGRKNNDMPGKILVLLEN
jgi:hypothetical protein